MRLSTLRGLRRALCLLPVLIAAATGACQGVDDQGQTSTPSGEQASGATEPTHGGTLVYAIPGDPQSCDLHMTGGMAYQSVHPCNTMLSQLLQVNPSDHSVIEPDLATEWVLSADGTTWTFKLREDVTWHDGRPFGADDVVFSLGRIVNPPQGLAVGRAAPFSEYVSSQGAISSSDASTVSITTDFPAASFLQNLASVYMSVYPGELMEARSTPTMARFEEVVGTGPFRSEQAVPGLRYEVTRNNEYYEPGLPFLDSVRFAVMPDSAVRLAALRAGQVDVIPIITESEAMALSGSANVTVYRSPSGGGNTLQLNLSRPPFDDPKVRRAVNLAISRDEASLALGEGYIGVVLPPGGRWAMPESEALTMAGYGNVEANRAEAMRLLEQAGYPNGLDLRIHTRTNFFFELLSDFAAGQLAEIGIRATVVAVEATAYQAMISSGDFSAIGHSHSFALDDPDAILGPHYTCGGPENYPGLCNERLDSLIDEQSRELDEARRQELLTEIERLVWDADAKIWLQWSARRTAVNSRVHGLEPGGPSIYQGMRLDRVWVD